MSAPTNQSIAIKHRLSNVSAIEDPGDDRALIDNLNAMLGRGTGLADVLVAVDDESLWPGSRQAAGQALRLELLNARAVLKAWWERKAQNRASSSPSPNQRRSSPGP
jgi:hypothetical protein